MKSLNNKKIILASQSPRRKELLEQACINFDIIPSNIDETCIKENSPEKLVKTLSYLKAIDIAKKHPDFWILGADTIVCLDELILEKPDSKKDAEQMLKMLSSKAHTVFTGFTLCCLKKDKFITDISQTEVCFKKLSTAEIQWYLNTKEYTDKAGAYAIQGKGSFLIKKINGSYTNVVGLPLCEVIQYFISENIIELKEQEIV
ncbi:MAG: septum formation protein Maf [Desulfobacteraceae bacterium]|nr:septum formation protein Maf [Desulfobacteraceae bacterium]